MGKEEDAAHPTAIENLRENRREQEAFREAARAKAAETEKEKR